MRARQHTSQYPARPGGNGECPSAVYLDAFDHKVLGYGETLICFSSTAQMKAENGGLRIPTAVDMGCGAGAMAQALGRAGLNVTAVDLNPPEGEESFYHHAVIGRVSYKQANFQRIDYQTLPPLIDIFYSQRALHYVPFAAAKNLLQSVSSRFPNRGVLAISVLGVNSPIVKHADWRHNPIEQRFGKIPAFDANRWNITRRVCPYTQQDLVDLASDLGLRVSSLRSTRFGIIKAILMKDPVKFR